MLSGTPVSPICLRCFILAPLFKAPPPPKKQLDMCQHEYDTKSGKKMNIATKIACFPDVSM